MEVIEQDETLPSSTPRFTISKYNEGFYNLDGFRTDCPYPDDAVKSFENFNTKYQRDRCLAEGLKLTFDEVEVGQKITFGRNQKATSVVIGVDIVNFKEHDGWYSYNVDTGVSRTHFEITRTNKGWELTDEGSTNGTKFISVDSTEESEDTNKGEKRKKRTSIDLRQNNEPILLKNGDIFYVEGATDMGFIHIFKFFQPDSDQPPYIIKGSARSLDELATAIGFYEDHPELIGKVPETTFSEKSEKEFNPIISELFNLQYSARNYFEKQEVPAYNRLTIEFYLKLMNFVNKFTNDQDPQRFIWTHVLSLINSFILNKKYQAETENKLDKVVVYEEIYEKIYSLIKFNDHDMIVLSNKPHS